MNAISWELLADKPETAVVHIGVMLDRSNFEDGVGVVQAACAAARRVIIDASRTRSLSTSGVFGLFNMLRVAGGEAPLDAETGWSGLRQMTYQAGRRASVPVLASDYVAQRLTAVGLERRAALCTTLDEALAACDMLPPRRRTAVVPQRTVASAGQPVHSLPIGRRLAGMWQKLVAAVGAA